jgi:chemotaxis protein methyltransferase CheR
LKCLNEDKNEIQNFINLVTTNETSFFRTQRVWDYLTNVFLPGWMKTNPRESLRIWSGAASTGEELYTIGICCEEFKAKNPLFTYSLIGTDIDTNVLATAEKGEYSGRSIEAFKNSNKAWFDKYLIPEGDGFKVIDSLRQKIKFTQHNLFNPPSQANTYHLVFLRNVLIYFEPEDCEKVLANISRALINQGTLVIGESESLSRLKTPFLFKAALVYENKKGS